MNIFRVPSCAETELVPGPARSGARSQNGMKWWSCSGVLASFWNTESWSDRPRNVVWRTLYSYRHTHEIFWINSWMCMYMHGRHNIYHLSSEESSVPVSGFVLTSYSTGNHIRVLACSFSARIFDERHVVIHIHNILDHDGPKSVPALALDAIHLGPVRLARRWVTPRNLFQIACVAFELDSTEIQDVRREPLVEAQLLDTTRRRSEKASMAQR